MNPIGELGSRHHRRFANLILIAAAVVGIDRLSKVWILRHFRLGESRPVTSFFHLTHIQNTGTAFGLFQHQNAVLLGMSLVIFGILLFSARGLCERGGLWGFWGISLILGGAVGNMIDRWLYGQVVDFLDFRIWPVFNLADSAISVGMIALIIGLGRR